MNLVPQGRVGTVAISVVASAIVIGFLRKSAMKETDPNKRKETLAAKLGLVDA